MRNPLHIIGWQFMGFVVIEESSLPQDVKEKLKEVPSSITVKKTNPPFIEYHRYINDGTVTASSHRPIAFWHRKRRKAEP